MNKLQKPIAPRILIAEGPWGIREGYTHVWGHETFTGYDTVTHKCPWKKNWLLKTYGLTSWAMNKEAPFCFHCNELVPNMIQTLWTLKNMDKIQADATSFYSPKVKV